VLVSALTTEIYTVQAQRWLADHADARLCSSDWVVAEFSSALSIKVRAGKVTEEGRNLLLNVFASITARSFEILQVARRDFRTAARFANRHELGLRGGDALHLAICEANDIAICTLDNRMRDAAITLGIGAVTP
jgi:predicted nucleic acid-binding protein